MTSADTLSSPGSSALSRSHPTVVLRSPPPRNTDAGDYDGRHVRLDGKRLLNFGSSSYLGLELRPELAQAARDAMCSFSTAFPFPRSNLDTPLHTELEAALAAMTGASAVLVTSSTALGHIAALPVLVGSRDAVLLDHSAQQSLHTATAVLKGVLVEAVRLSRLERLEARVRELSETHERVWLVLDAVDANFGDFAPFDALERLLQTYPKLELYIDDSESTSWFGRHGRGVAQERLGGNPRVVVMLGLDRSFAAVGGALLFADTERAVRVRRLAGQLLSAPIPAPMLGAALASVKLQMSPEFAELQGLHRQRIDFMFELAEVGRIPLASAQRTPVFFLHCRTPEQAQELARALEAQGFYTSACVFPAVSPQSSGVRFTISVHNELADIERFADVLGNEAEKLRSVRRPWAAVAQ